MRVEAKREAQRFDITLHSSALPCTSGRGGVRTRTSVTGHGILSPEIDSPNAPSHQDLREVPNGMVPVLVPSSPKTDTFPDLPPDLASIVAAWPGLPEAIKAGVLTIVRASAAKGPSASINERNEP